MTPKTAATVKATMALAARAAAGPPTPGQLSSDTGRLGFVTPSRSQAEPEPEPEPEWPARATTAGNWAKATQTNTSLSHVTAAARRGVTVAFKFDLVHWQVTVQCQA